MRHPLSPEDPGRDEPPGRPQAGPTYDGRRVVGAMMAGVGIGLLIALFLKTVIDNSTVVLPQQRIFWLFLITSASGALFGLAVESMRQLQASNPDPAYHRRRKRSAARR